MNLLSGVSDDSLTLELVNVYDNFSRLNEGFGRWGDISLDKMQNPEFLEQMTENSYSALSAEGKTTVLSCMLE